MRLPQRPDPTETERRIERAYLQELRIHRASPIPDARDAYDDLKSRILQLLTRDLDQQERTVSQATIQAKLDAYLAEEKIILKRLEKRQLTNDLLVELAGQRNVPVAGKTPNSIYTVQELAAAGMLTQEAAAFLEEAVLARSNIIICGQERTGKTTLLRALCKLIPIQEQVVTIEESAELLLDRENLVSPGLETTTKARGPQIPLQTLLISSARMHPDRIILDSLCNSAVRTWLQLISNDLRGSIATSPAENPQILLADIESIILNGDPRLAKEAIHQQIKSGIDLVVHLQKLPGHSLQIAMIGKIAEGDDSEFVLIDAL